MTSAVSEGRRLQAALPPLLPSGPTRRLDDRISGPDSQRLVAGALEHLVGNRRPAGSLGRAGGLLGKTLGSARIPRHRSSLSFHVKHYKTSPLTLTWTKTPCGTSMSILTVFTTSTSEAS